MRCPFCAFDDSRVIDSREAEDGIRRRRECLGCGRRFTTFERVQTAHLMVVKKDGRREEFSRDKVLAGVRRACDKRPVSSDDLERLADRVERIAQERGEKEVSSRFIGERVLDELARVDVLAAARFASVFLDFQNAKDYAEFFETASRRGRSA